jgi:hypothetical protein
VRDRVFRDRVSQPLASRPDKIVTGELEIGKKPYRT